MDKLTDVKEDKTYKAILLENQYVQYSILPELGGRIFTGLDKTDGYDFIYRQHVIKPALIGMIGAWISGGVEWNIPHHHRASTFMTVDHRLVDNAEGSKTVWLGEIERRHRMKWLVGLTLYPDKSYLKVTVKTVQPHAAAPFATVLCQRRPCQPSRTTRSSFRPARTTARNTARANSLPGRSAAASTAELDRRGVDSELVEEPAYAGLDLRLGRTRRFLRRLRPRQEGRHGDLRRPPRRPGQEVLRLGQRQRRPACGTRSSPTRDGPYLELMAGGYSDNQPDYSWIEPGEMKVVEQYFYPIRELGGISRTPISTRRSIWTRPARMPFAWR